MSETVLKKLKCWDLRKKRSNRTKKVTENIKNLYRNIIRSVGHIAHMYKGEMHLNF
jgi:hypothetical protein